MNPTLLPILKKTARTLYLSIKALPLKMRNPFCIAYLLCRAADSVADTRIIPHETRIGWIHDFPDITTNPEKRKLKLNDLIEDIYDSADLPSEKELIKALPVILAEYDRLSPDEREITAQVVKDVCLGMITDLTFFGKDRRSLKAFKSEEQLDEYCYFIGGGPGLFWTRLAIIHGVLPQDPVYEKQAAEIGKALQITNILRDVASDLRIGRCYLPQADLKRAGLDPDDLFDRASVEKFRPVIKKWILWAVGNLDQSQDYVNAISRKHFGMRAAVVWPVYWCLDSLAQIAASKNLLSPDLKTKISRGRIYATIAKTPAVLLSKTAFAKGYRLRREILLSGISETDA